MPPGLGVILFGGVGYVLVYAAMANHGRFATHPWAGLAEDAYTGKRAATTGPDQGAPTGPQGPTGPSAPPSNQPHLGPNGATGPTGTTSRGRRTVRPRLVAA